MRIAYLIGQYPHLNHGYLLNELRVLRGLGWQVEVASVADCDRPLAQLTEEELAEQRRTWYVKSTPRLRILAMLLPVLARRPLAVLACFGLAWRLGAGSLSTRVHHLAYAIEALLVGRWLEQRGVSHVHISFCGTVGVLMRRVFPMTVSIGIYGYGELHDPRGSHLRRRIASSLFVRSISRFGQNQMMLSCPRSEWVKLEYAPLGIDPGLYAARGKRSVGTGLTLITVGRLAPEKGQFFLIRALAKLAREGVACRLRLVGDGPDRAGLEAEAHELGFSEAVTFLGAVGQEQLLELYRDADVMVMTSLAEGIPMVLMEAMCGGLPCLAPRLAGIPELIREEHDGLLYTPADEAQFMAAVRRLAGDPALRARLAEGAARKVPAEYDLATNTARFAELMAKWLS